MPPIAPTVVPIISHYNPYLFTAGQARSFIDCFYETENQTPGEIVI